MELGILQGNCGRVSRWNLQQYKKRCLYTYQHCRRLHQFRQLYGYDSQGPGRDGAFFFSIYSIMHPSSPRILTWPEEMIQGFVKKYPMLFVGGATSITHMHFDIDLSHILHTQFMGRKRVLLFPFSEQHKLYRKPFEVLSLADFSNYYLEEREARL